MALLPEAFGLLQSKDQHSLNKIAESLSFHGSFLFQYEFFPRFTERFPLFASASRFSLSRLYPFCLLLSFFLCEHYLAMTFAFLWDSGQEPICVCAARSVQCKGQGGKTSQKSIWGSNQWSQSLLAEVSCEHVSDYDCKRERLLTALLAGWRIQQRRRREHSGAFLKQEALEL